MSAIAVTLVVVPNGGVTATNGPKEVLADIKDTLETALYTVYTDGAEAHLVAVPSNEANPSFFAP
jgi:hypothetical protein